MFPSNTCLFCFHVTHLEFPRLTVFLHMKNNKNKKKTRRGEMIEHHEKRIYYILCIYVDAIKLKLSSDNLWNLSDRLCNTAENNFHGFSLQCLMLLCWIPCRARETSGEWNEAPNWCWMTGNYVQPTLILLCNFCIWISKIREVVTVLETQLLQLQLKRKKKNL